MEEFSKLKINIEKIENWPERDLNVVYQSANLFATIVGGYKTFGEQLGEIIIERTDTGTSLGLAYRGKIKFTAKSSLSAWTVFHELAHTWDAKHNWNLSSQLEKFTGGFTNKKLSLIKRLFPIAWDAGKFAPERKPGFYGRKPGCNAAGYFYGDIPSGSNWNFNRKEDFAESFVMYCGWGHENELSKTAHGRIERYLLPNGTKDPLYGVIDNWSDYSKFFYPKNGDYTKTKRWQFINQLIQNISHQ